MRPDQHKQKKNAQYKKKHGMQGKGGVEQEKGKANDPKGRGKGRGQGAKFEQDPDKGLQKSHNAASVSSSSNENPSQEIGPAVVVAERQFSRREVVSNWARYEGLDESSREYDSQRGADFSTVLHATTGSLAQFRLQSEQDWGLDGEEAEDPAGDSGYLSVDVADLAAAIQCVPLHTRLGLEEELFADELIEHFDKDASSKLQAYQADPSRKIKHISSVPIEQSALSSESADSEITNTLDSGAACDMKKEVDSDEGCDVLEEILNLNTEKTEPVLETKNGSEKISDRKTTKSDTISTQSKSDSTKGGKSSVKKYTASTHVNVQKQEEELDFLLSLDTPEKHCAPGDGEADSDSSENNESKKKSTNSAAKSDGGKSSNLDDWLDSMLGDEDD